MQKTSPPKLFDAKRQIAIEARSRNIAAHDADFLYQEAAQTIAERLDATNRNFDKAVDLFSPLDCMREHLKASSKTAKVKVIATPQNEISSKEVLQLEQNSTNLITSVFGLHRVNDLPGMLTQISRALVADGLFSACLPGDRTLNELRTSMLEAESDLAGTASLRVDPFIEVRQAGGLLQRAGFALPVVDSDILTVRYDRVKDIVRDLRSMGATSAMVQRVKYGPRKLLAKVEEIYHEKFSDPDGRIRATVEIIYLSGWKPDISQQKPLKPGSAIKNLKDVL